MSDKWKRRWLFLAVALTSVLILGVIIMKLVIDASKYTTNTASVECFGAEYPDSIGLEVGKKGQVVEQFLTGGQGPADELPVYDQPRDGKQIGVLLPRTVFTIVEGPMCWAPIRTSNALLDHRLWHIQTDNVSGWVEEYYHQLGTHRLLRPYDSKTAIQIGAVMPEPPDFQGTLKWDGVMDKERATNVFDVRFQAAGYITLELQGSYPELTETTDPQTIDLELTAVAQATPDRPSSGGQCRLKVDIAPGAPQDVYGNREAAYYLGGTFTSSKWGDRAKALWVQPGTYHIQIQLVHLAYGAIKPFCEDTTYHLRFSQIDYPKPIFRSYE